ncbi:hypothetical protein AB1I63_07420 [Streptococcus pneumoniae]
MEIGDVKSKLQEHSNILVNLKNDGILRTNNSPVGDYAEWLAVKVLNLKLEKNSEKGIDAKDRKNCYQIKARKANVNGKLNRMLGIIRDYDENDKGNKNKYLIVLFFDFEYNVSEAYEIPYSILSKLKGNKSKHENGLKITLGERLIEQYKKEIKNITDKFTDKGA